MSSRGQSNKRVPGPVDQSWKEGPPFLSLLFWHTTDYVIGAAAAATQGLQIMMMNCAADDDATDRSIAISMISIFGGRTGAA